MRRLAVLAGALALASCAPLPPPSALSAPVASTDATTLDESAALAVELAVSTSADLATLAVKSGVVPDAMLPTLRQRSADARMAVYAVRAAYDAGNAASYDVAVDRALAAINAVRGIAKGEVR